MTGDSFLTQIAKRAPTVSVAVGWNEVLAGTLSWYIFLLDVVSLLELGISG